MRRLAALIPVCVALSVTAWAAPAPLPRPSRAWMNGWEPLRDPVGDCRCRRSGDKLTLTLPARRAAHAGPGECPAGVRLMREVRGDFVAQVRVRGTLLLPAREGDAVRWWAGLMVTDGAVTNTVQRSGAQDEDGKGTACWLYYNTATADGSRGATGKT